MGAFPGLTPTPYDSGGIGGRFAQEQVAGIHRNRWPTSPEYAGLQHHCKKPFLRVAITNPNCMYFLRQACGWFIAAIRFEKLKIKSV